MSTQDPAPTPQTRYSADTRPSQLGHELPAALRSSHGQRPREMAALPDLPLTGLGLPGPPPPSPIPSSVTDPASFELQAPPRQKLAPGNRLGAAGAAAPGGGARPGARSHGEGAWAPPGQCSGGRGPGGGACWPCFSARPRWRPPPLPAGWGGALGERECRTLRRIAEEGGAGGRRRGLGVEDGCFAGGSECFERRKWRLVLVPPLPTRFPPLFATSHAPSDQRVPPTPVLTVSSSWLLAGFLALHHPLPRSWCFLNPSCCTEFTCPIILVYFHLVFSDTSPTPSSKIRFLRCVLYIFYPSAFNIICWNYKRASFGGETVKAH